MRLHFESFGFGVAFHMFYIYICICICICICLLSEFAGVLDQLPRPMRTSGNPKGAVCFSKVVLFA